MIDRLDEREIAETLRAAAESQTSVIVTVLEGERWLNLTSRCVAWEDPWLLIDVPVHDDGPAVEFEPGQPVHLTFRCGHDKYTSRQMVSQVVPPGDRPDAAAGLLALDQPSRMQRLQRRNVARLGVPRDCFPPAFFWLGEKQDEPGNMLPERPVWPGTVIDVSAHGIRLLADRNSTKVLEIGDSVGLKLRPQNGEAVYLNTQYRHLETLDADDQKVLMGFRFLISGSDPHVSEVLADLIEAVEPTSADEADQPDTAPAEPVPAGT